MFVLQEINADEFVEFMIKNHPYQSDFNGDIQQIQPYLNNEFKKEASTTEDILKFMLNNLEYEFQIPNSETKFTCSDYFEKWLNQIETQNKNVPNIGFDTTDILIAILAFTGTGISWIIWSLCDPYHQPISKFVIGVINILISGLFVCSIFFGWVLAVQIILGILFALLAIVTAFATIYNAYNSRDVRRQNNEIHREYMSNRINDMRDYLKQVKSKSEQSKNDESDKSNDKIKGEADNQNNNFPDSQKFENENDKKK